MQAAADLELGGLEVDVGPAQAGELAAPQAAGQGEDDHRLDRVAAEGGQVGARLLGRQHVLLRAPRLLGARDALHGVRLAQAPDDRLAERPFQEDVEVQAAALRELAVAVDRRELVHPPLQLVGDER